LTSLPAPTGFSDGQLKNNLKRRGYKQNIIKKSFNKANNISRSSLLQYREKQKCKRTPYHTVKLLESGEYIYIYITEISKRRTYIQLI
jgi:hypothetical protein